MTFTDGIRKRFEGSDKKALALQGVGILLGLLFFAYLFVMALQMRLNDPDLWWHLKTGDYIMKHGDIPDVDPFAYTTPRPLTKNQKIGMRSQWLGQVALYFAHKAGGLIGVVYYRNFLIILPMLLLFIWLIRNKVPAWQSLIFISMPAMMLCIQLFYSFERPQGLSFNLVIVVCILLNRIRRKALVEGVKFDHSYWLLPVTMVLWSNIHGGYLVGCYIIMIYVFSEALMYGWRRLVRKQQEPVPWIFLAVCAASISSVAMNPNGPAMFYSYTKGLVNMFVSDVSRYTTGGGGAGWVKEVVLEFKPLWYFYKELHYDWLILYWLFTAMTFATMIARFILRRELDLSELLTVGFISLFANMYARGLMFSLTVLPFYFAKNVILLEVPKKSFRIALKGTIVMALALGIGFVTYTYKNTPRVFKPRVSTSWVSPWYPSRLVQFVMNVKPAPPMYNYYTWGGFLIWKMFPEYQVFIDGRAIDNQTTRTADQILKTFPGWQQRLDVYNINFVAIPVIFRESGHIIPLATALVNDNRWKLVFVAQNSALFVRDHPRNREIIRKYNRDKRLIYREIISVENIFLKTMPWNPVFNIAKADALLGLGRYAEAKALYEKFPRKAAKQLQRLRKMGF